jgi:uncharacterized phage protein gp47/JayE
MADPTTKTFGQLVQQQAAAVQAAASGLIDFSVGSILRAVVQAVAAVGLWLQGLILLLLATTRLATSAGVDADSWVADFGGPFVEGGEATFARLAATGSNGSLTFLRLSTTGAATVPIGATVETADGSQRFTVALDTGNADYDAGLGGYVMSTGDGSIDVPALAVSTGAASNVLAGTVTVITSPIVGVDMVTNASPFAGGADPESDEALRVRWRGYLQSLREATPAAVLYYVKALQPGVDAILVEDAEINGAARRGFFYVVADDGSGDPPTEFENAVSASIDAHRAAGIEFASYSPVAVDVDIAVGLLELAVNADEADVTAKVEKAITAHIAALKISEDVTYNRLFQVAYDAMPDLLRCSVTLNAGTADVAITSAQVARLDDLTVA